MKIELGNLENRIPGATEIIKKVVSDIVRLYPGCGQKIKEVNWEFGESDIEGVYAAFNGSLGRVILYDTITTERELILTVAHEVYHIMHRQAYVDNARRYGIARAREQEEWAAEAFARRYLNTMK